MQTSSTEDELAVVTPSVEPLLRMASSFLVVYAADQVMNPIPGSFHVHVHAASAADQFSKSCG